MRGGLARTINLSKRINAELVVTLPDKVA